MSWRVRGGGERRRDTRTRRAFKSALAARERDFICLCICPRWKREFTFGKQTLLTKLRQRTHRRAKPIARKNHFRTSIGLSFSLALYSTSFFSLFFSLSLFLSRSLFRFIFLSVVLSLFLSFSISLSSPCLSRRHSDRDNIDALLKFSPFHRFDSNLPRS